jgi:hypothetical protein
MINTVVLPHNGSVRGAKPHRRIEINQKPVPPSCEASQTKRQKMLDIAGRLLDAAGKIRYGSAAVNLKIHDGRIVDVIHTKTESIRENAGWSNEA